MINIPDISIIMPVFNGEKTIGSAINSILDQSYESWELIILNDGSNDKTSQIIDSYKDQRIHHVKYEKKEGIVVRLNNGIDLSKGPFIARMDADDLSHPLRLEKQIAFLHKNPNIGLVGTKAMFFSDRLRPIGFLRFAETHKEITKNKWMGFALAHPSWCGRKEIFRKIRYRSFQYAEDQDFLFRASKITQLAGLPETLLFYKQTSRPWSKEWGYRKGLIKVVYTHLGFFQGVACFSKALLMMIFRKVLPGKEMRPNFNLTESASYLHSQVYLPEYAPSYINKR